MAGISPEMAVKTIQPPEESGSTGKFSILKHSIPVPSKLLY